VTKQCSFAKSESSLTPKQCSFAVKECFFARSGHRAQTTDAYLFGLAIHKRGVLATVDTSIAALVEKNSGYLKSLTILEA
jgi:hypothetical protein